MFSFDEHFRKWRGAAFGSWTDELAAREVIQAALAVLEDALARCRDEDMRGETVFAALSFLETRSPKAWPMRAFRRALDCESPDARWQNANAALNGIRRQFGL